MNRPWLLKFSSRDLLKMLQISWLPLRSDVTASHCGHVGIRRTVENLQTMWPCCQNAFGSDVCWLGSHGQEDLEERVWRGTLQYKNLFGVSILDNRYPQLRPPIYGQNISTQFFKLCPTWVAGGHAGANCLYAMPCVTDARLWEKMRCIPIVVGCRCATHAKFHDVVHSNWHLLAVQPYVVAISSNVHPVS